MNQLLREGQVVHTVSSNTPCEVQGYIGGGGQGEVYKARLGSSSSVALKWYFPNLATPEQRASLETNARAGAPNDKFLWPMDLVQEGGVESFGYIMPLREDRYKGMLDWIFRRIKPSFRALAIAGRDLANGFWQLHAKGLCYRDISFGNVFFDPDTGDVLICDNDNVSIDGNPNVSVLGTQKFMAPEIVRGEALPSADTDRYSLAVLLFYMLILNHPLEGKREADIHCFDDAAGRQIYGERPTFIFDPVDTSNRPEPGWQDNALIFWPIYPQFVRNLFIKAFTDGLRDPQNGRVRETTWRDAMISLHDSIFYCSHCSAENFYDVEALRANGGKPNKCWKCQQQPQLPFRIRIGNKVVMLNHDSRLYPYHIINPSPFDFSTPVAEVTRHPTNPSVWGLKNLTSEKWIAATAAGAASEVPPGRSTQLAIGTKINFGRTEGQVTI